MKKLRSQDGFIGKLITALILSVAIFCGLLYLLVSGKTEKLEELIQAKKTSEPTAEVVESPVSTSTPETVISAEPEKTAAATASASAETASPEKTAEAEKTAAPEKTADPESSSESASHDFYPIDEEGNSSTVVTTADAVTDDSLQKIVNLDNPISSDYEPEDLVVPEVEMYGEQTLRIEAAAMIEKMFEAAEEDGIYLCLESGYRSYAEQFSLYQTYLYKYGAAYTNSIDSHPGCCEHQLGLAADLTLVSGVCSFEKCFDSTDGYAWLMEHAAEYGWILRFPEDGEESTGISYSPWHFRYVGVGEAKRIAASGKTMEEYYFGIE